MSESYDEVVFTDPNEQFFDMLMAYCPSGGCSSAPVKEETAVASSSVVPGHKALKALQISSSSTPISLAAPLSFSVRVVVYGLLC